MRVILNSKAGKINSDFMVVWFIFPNSTKAQSNKCREEKQPASGNYRLTNG
jgi:hypothetical protein